MSLRQQTGLTPGKRVRVHYQASPPVDAVVVEPPTRFGWVKVEQDYEGQPLQFDAAVEFIEILDPPIPAKVHQ